MNYLIKLLMAMTLAIAGSHAQALVINQGDCETTTIECTYGNQTSTDAINVVIEEYLVDMYSIKEVYKSEVPEVGADLIPNSIVGIDEKSYADSYETTFSNTSTNPTEAWIKYVTGPIIDCPSCWLLVKDGNHSPAWYLFNISNWNGEEDIYLNGFWSGGGGAISHVAIYGGPPGTSVLAPGPLGIMSIGLLLISVMRRLKES